MDVGWSELPFDLVENIARRLTVFVDYVRLRAVCRIWRSSLSPKPHQLPCQFPWLMLRSESELLNGDLHGFVDLLENKVHQLNMQISFPWKRCCGSSQGWLVLLEERGPAIVLFNPLTRIQIQLPPMTTFPNVLDFDSRKVGEEYLIATSFGGNPKRYSLDEMHDNYIKKVVLSASPTSHSEDFVAVAMVGIAAELAFCKKGDERWTILEDSMFYDDFIYYEGVIYAVSFHGSFTIYDVSGSSPSMKVIKLPSPIQSDASYFNKLYLVDSFGELLMVSRLFDPVHVIDKGSTVYDTIGFEVASLNSRRTEWVEVKSLGDRLLFLGTSSSLCLSASEFSRCDGNCIYFTGESNKVENHSYWNRDSGFFSLGDGSTKGLPNCTSNRNSSLLPPLWLTPNPC